MENDIDLDLGEEAAPEVEAPELVEGEVEEAPAAPTAAQFRVLEDRLAEMAGKSSANADMAPLVDMARKFFEKQNQPKPDDGTAGAAALAQFGEQLQQAVLTGKPEDLGGLIMRAVHEVAGSRVDQALTQRGGPIAEKAGQYALSAFLNDMGDEVGEGKADLHKKIKSELPKSLSAREKQFIATASVEDTNSFLRSKYRQTAGDILLQAKPARPKDIGGGNAGGASGQNSTVRQLFQGIPEREARRLESLLEIYWPDPKQRALHAKSFLASMAEG